NEVRLRPLIDISQGRRLELTIEGICIPLPFCVHITRTSQEIANTFVDELTAPSIGSVSVLGLLAFEVKGNGRVSGESKVAGSKIGEKGRYACRIRRRNRNGIALFRGVLRAIQVARITHSFSAEQIPAGRFVGGQHRLARVSQRIIKLRRERTHLR